MLNKESKIAWLWIVGTVWSFIIPQILLLSYGHSIASFMGFQTFFCGIFLIKQELEYKKYMLGHDNEGDGKWEKDIVRKQ